MQSRQALAFKLVGTGMSFLMLALASIGLTLWVTWQLEGGAAAVNEAGRMRMLTYRMALDVAGGDRGAVVAQAAAIDTTLELLRAGDPSRPLFIPGSDEAQAELAGLRTQWSSLRSRWTGSAPAAVAGEARAFVDHIDRFVSLIEQRLSHWTAVLRGFQLLMLAVAIASAVLMLYATHRMVFEPLRRLGAGLASIRAGNFHARVEPLSNDEFGELADGFNAMAEHLQSLYGRLETKVREKTARLEIERARLSALYEVSAFVAGAENLDELARGFVARVRRIARADAVAVRWSDEGNQRYLMLAHDGLPPALTHHEQCLPAGGCHCGQTAATAATRVISIRGMADSQGHCARAGFETLVTVPIRLHHRVLGEIDLFYRGVADLTDERSLVETLAGHLAGGIEGLRAAAAAKESAVAAERTLLAQELHDSIAQSLAFMKIQVGLLRDSLRRGDDTATTRTMGELEAGVRESYADVRELLVHFRTRTNAEDIEPALRSTLKKFEHQTGLATTLQRVGHGVPLPTDVQVQVLHVLQEALSNVRKHASASSVRVTVQQNPEWRFEVADDGAGFDSAADAGESHVGLRIMRERAERIGARIDIESFIGSGTRVVLTVPRPEAAPAQEEPEDETADTPAGR
ncbi:MAG TPA: type IV pili methyl-accepting chemotaxis transducer N-terminal domain-containing protein [Albitalea sp.]|nr:type IV pili methyl-accepting chemotaxis transducer N-terminal domain-containing protein [Albitalea sp.]